MSNLPGASADSPTTFRATRSDGQMLPDSRYNKDHKKVVLDGQDQKWFAKLGELAAEQLYPGSDKTFTVEAFPDGYHLRAKARPVAGGKDGKPRYDWYLYGYPTENATAIPRYFRSVPEFWHHFLWLLTDKDMNRENCTCPLCRGPRPSSQRRGTSAVAGPGSVSDSGSPAPRGPPAAKPSQKPSAKKGASSGQPPAQPAITPTTRATIPSTTPSAAQRSTEAPARLASSVAQPNESILFREGEVVWFKNDHTSFRLGLILPQDDRSPRSLMSEIAPLTHPRYPINIVKRTEADMRPFLTFSVPPIHSIVEPFAGQPVGATNWDAIDLSAYGGDRKDEVLSMEASKIAASRVDHSYSLFNAIDDPSNTPAERSFGGVFLGCEKVEVGEAVRVKFKHQGDEADIFAMVVNKIVLRRSNIDGEKLFFFGDIWHLKDVAILENTYDSSHLPAAMQREKAFHDRVKGFRGIKTNWVCVQRNVTEGEDFIRGRFYESEKVGHSLIAGWSASLQRGVVEPIQKCLNNRFDAKSKSIPYIGRTRSRADSVAGAVPPNTVLSFGPRVVEWS